MIDRNVERSPADGLLEAGWLLVAILVPLGVNLWAKQPFEPAKAAVLRSLTWIMTGLWLMEALVGRRVPGCRPQGNPLWAPALTVAAFQVLSSVLSVDPGLSLWGSYERAQGLLTQLSYLLLFLLVSAWLRTTDQAGRVRTAMVATAVPLVVLGLAQAFGWHPVPLDVVSFSGMAPPLEENGPPVVQVTKVSTANSTAIAGVVYRRFNSQMVSGTLRSDGQGTAPDLEITSAGPVAPGEYLLLVVHGPAQSQYAGGTHPAREPALQCRAGRSCRQVCPGHDRGHVCGPARDGVGQGP
ncbi:MAG: hypothetical protein ACUVWZ_12680 [Anaerolineae bacterium]